MAAKRKRKTPKKRKRARARALQITLRFAASDASMLRALAKQSQTTPRKFVHGMVRAAVSKVRELPLAIRPVDRGGLAAAVKKAGKARGVARFHDDRAFIGSIYEHLKRRGELDGMSLADFKRRLIELHRAGLLRLTRADLVGAMPRAEVDRSEARFQDATFHFVALD